MKVTQKILNALNKAGFDLDGAKTDYDYRGDDKFEDFNEALTKARFNMDTLRDRFAKEHTSLFSDEHACSHEFNEAWLIFSTSDSSDHPTVYTDGSAQLNEFRPDPSNGISDIAMIAILFGFEGDFDEPNFARRGLEKAIAANPDQYEEYYIAGVLKKELNLTAHNHNERFEIVADYFNLDADELAEEVASEARTVVQAAIAICVNDYYGPDYFGISQIDCDIARKLYDKKPALCRQIARRFVTTVAA